MPEDILPVITGIEGPYRPIPGSEKDPVYLYQNVEIMRISDDGYAAKARGRYTRNPSDSTDDASSSRGRGIIEFQDYEDIIVDEDTLYYSGGSTTITGGNSFFADYTASFVSHKQTAVDNLVIINAGHSSTHASANHGNVWYMADATSAPTRITDADMPGNNGTSLIRGGASLDGYLFLGDINGQIHNCDLNDFTVWTATNFLTAEREADIGVYIGKHHDHVVYIGTKSIEFFYNAGNPSGSPLTRRQDVSYRVGCVYPNTVVEIDDVIYFLGIGPAGRADVYKLEGFQLTVLTNGAAQWALAYQARTPDPLTTLVTMDADIFMAYLNNPNTGPTLYLTAGNAITHVLNIESGVWSTQYVDDTPTNTGLISDWTGAVPIIMSSYPTYRRSIWTNAIVCSAINTLGNDTPNSDVGLSATPNRYVYFRPWDARSMRKKRVLRTEVLHYPAATTNSTYDGASALLSWIDLDTAGNASFPAEADFTNERSISLNTANSYINRCGTTRQRIHRLDIADNGVSVILGLKIKYEFVGE